MSLTSQLKQKAEESKNVIPENIYAVMEKANDDLIKEKIGSDSIKVEATFPNVSLLNTKGFEVNLKESLKDSDYLIVSFYRGGWCPYCNIELKGLQDSLNEFNNAGANLVAITPELPDYSSATSENNNVAFDVFTDKGSKLSKEIGIAFDMPEALKPIYDQFGLDVKAHNGDFTLPIPATFILDKNLNVLYKFIDIDYKKRLDPQEILDFIRSRNQ